MNTHFQQVAVVGAGAMGQGIAQMCAQAGAQVLVHDVAPGAAAKACQAIGAQWLKLQDKGRLTAQDVTQFQNRLHPATELKDLSACHLVIEAVVENTAIKTALFAELEQLLSPLAVIATNTSSLSVTALAAQLKHPARFAGLHFFNPVPLMKVVEVIAGLGTADAVCEQLTQFVSAMGHQAVRAKDTPGFIVNHAGRGYGTEALRIVSEGVADFATIDAILKDQVGFKLGPFELMDLTALDVSHPVMESIYHQYYEEPRYRPSVITAQRLAGGWLGRKSGQGFYSYVDGKAQLGTPTPAPVVSALPPVWVSSRAARRSDLFQLLKDLGAEIETASAPSNQALCLVAPLGFDVTTCAIVERLDPARTLGIDMLMPDAATRRRVLATNPATRRDMRDAAHALFAKDGKPVSVIQDSGGFVTQRVLAQIVNIACDICQQGICSPADLDIAVTLGLGYPQGPLALGDTLGADSLLEVLFNMQTVYGDPRYRPSPWLRRRGALGLSLRHDIDTA
jgi:3-hydroxybutyryl-CoA dehydrogenase